MKHSMLALAALLAVAVVIVFAFGCRSKPERAEITTAPVQEAVLAQTKCPVMGGKINKALYVDHEGKRIYVCCPACLDKITQDPEKYIKQLEDQGVVLDRTPGAADAQ